MCATIARSYDEIKAILDATAPGEHPVGELLEALPQPAALAANSIAQEMLRETEAYLQNLDRLPLTTYTLYREFLRIGERKNYEREMGLKRARLRAAVLRLYLGQEEYIPVAQDYIWNICEETNWVMPAHERMVVDLGAVGVGWMLAEIIVSLGDKLGEEITQRVRHEIERRILAPFFANPDQFWWFKGTNNWNGVCNGAIGCMLLLLEEDQERLARGLALVLSGLEVFLDTAFEADGTSTEGPGYWAYGLSTFIPFSEMLRHRTNAQLDLLSTPRMRQIATYPGNIMLSPGHFASFSDSHEETAFAPGLIQRLAERTGVPRLRDLLAPPARLQLDADWRNTLWWDGRRPAQASVYDIWLKDGAVVRLTGATPDGKPVVLVAKAGHNAENHNQNDLGSFILHVDGETYLADPGGGLYSRAYFSPQRYENIFANSFGHSVPRIGGHLQSPGREFTSEIIHYDASGADKVVVMRLEKGYDVPQLSELERKLTLTRDGALVLEDRFAFADSPLPVEEAFITWLDAAVSGETARLLGAKHTFELAIEEPTGAHFQLAVLAEESAANRVPIPLKRLSISLPPASQTTVRVRAAAQ